MQPDIIIGHKYVALNTTEGKFNVPIWSIVIPTKIGKKLISFQVKEFPSNKVYSFMTGHDKFIHLFKPIHSEWVTKALKRDPSYQAWEFIANDYLGD